MVNGIVIRGELLEIARSPDIRTDYLQGEFMKRLDKIMDLAEITTQHPEGMTRVLAMTKLKRINPLIRIVKEAGRMYVNEPREGERHKEVFYEIPQIKEESYYINKFKHK